MGAGEVEHADAGRDQRRAALRARQQRPHLCRVLRVVQQDQDPAAVQDRAVQRRPFLQAVGDGRVRRAEGPQEGAEDRLRLRRSRPRTLEVDVQLAVRERRAGPVGHVDGEGGLAHAAYAGQGRDRHDPALRLGRRGQDRRQVRDEGGAAGEVGDRRRELGRADRGRRRLRHGGRRFRQGRVRLEDALLEFAEAGPGVDAQFLRQEAAGVGVHREGLRLAAAAVQRQHEEFAQALPERVGRRQGRQFRDRLGVAALFEVEVEAGFEEDQAPLLQAGPLGLGVRAGDSGQGFAVPQVEGLVQERAGPAQVARTPRLLRLRRQVLRDRQVQGALAQAADGVAAGLADQDLGVQRLPQPGGVGADRGQGLGGRLGPPQRVDQFRRRGRTALAQQQCGQQGALLGEPVWRASSPRQARTGPSTPKRSGPASATGADPARRCSGTRGPPSMRSPPRHHEQPRQFALF